MSDREYIVRVKREDDSFWAEVIDLPGCFASGRSLDELRDALEEAIFLYVRNDAEAETPGRPDEPARAPAPHHMEVGEMRVKVPS